MHKMLASNTGIAITLLNLNGLNTPIKRERLPDWIIKQTYAVYR